MLASKSPPSAACAGPTCLNGACGGYTDDVYTAMTDCIEHSGDSVSWCMSFQTDDVVTKKCGRSTGE